MDKSKITYIPTPLRKARLCLGFTSEEMGELLGVTFKTIEILEANELKEKPLSKTMNQLLRSSLEQMENNNKEFS